MEGILWLIAIVVGFTLGKRLKRQEEGLVRPQTLYDRHHVLFR